MPTMRRRARPLAFHRQRRQPQPRRRWRPLRPTPMTSPPPTQRRGRLRPRLPLGRRDHRPRQRHSRTWSERSRPAMMVTPVQLRPTWARAPQVRCRSRPPPLAQRQHPTQRPPPHCRRLPRHRPPQRRGNPPRRHPSPCGQQRPLQPAIRGLRPTRIPQSPVAMPLQGTRSGQQRQMPRLRQPARSALRHRPRRRQMVPLQRPPPRWLRRVPWRIPAMPKSPMPCRASAQRVQPAHPQRRPQQPKPSRWRVPRLPPRACRRSRQRRTTSIRRVTPLLPLRAAAPTPSPPRRRWRRILPSQPRRPRPPPR